MTALHTAPTIRPPRGDIGPGLFPPNPGLRDYVRYFRMMGRNPLEFFSDGYFEAPLVMGRFLGRPYAIVHEPDSIRHFLVTQADHYGLAHLRRVFFENTMPDGIITVEGERWKQMRHAMSPVFTPRRIKGFAATMRDVVLARAEHLARQDGARVALTDEMLSLTLDVLMACLFPRSLQYDKVLLSERLETLFAKYGFPHWFDFLDAPKWLPRVGRAEERRLRAGLRAQASAILAERRANLTARDAEYEGDFLTLLMQAGRDDGAPLTDDEVIDNLQTFIAAGHETTARTLVWMFYLLSRDAGTHARLLNEIRAVDRNALPVEQWAAAMPLASAVIKETLRLYPAASNIMRVALRDDVIAGHQITQGTDVVVSPWVLHRHRALWRDPDDFDPTRFLPPEGDTIDRFAYLPFGAGPRVCIGAQFAMQEMLIVLVEFLSRFEFHYDNAAEPKPVLRFTIKPMEEIYMRIRGTPDIARTEAA